MSLRSEGRVSCTVSMMGLPRLILKQTWCWAGPRQHPGGFGTRPPPIMRSTSSQGPSPQSHLLRCFPSAGWSRKSLGHLLRIKHSLPDGDGEITDFTHLFPLLQGLFPFTVSLHLSPSLPYRLSCLPHWPFLSFPSFSCFPLMAARQSILTGGLIFLKYLEQ